MVTSFARLHTYLYTIFSRGTILLTILIGGLVGGNFSITKYIVTHGISPLATLFWMLIIASSILIVVLLLTNRRLELSRQYLRYYVISGFLGIAAPQYLSYLVLKEIPVGFFTVLVTLSPLCTVILTSSYEQKWVPLNRTIGILFGLGGVTLATYTGLDLSKTGLDWLLISFAIPVLLGITNLYRSKAYPTDAHPIPLAAGMLLSQVIFLWPVLLYVQESYTPFNLALTINWAVFAIGFITAISYILTFELQRRTDGVGFSQVGYFVTIFGLIIGTVAFNEPLSPLFIASVLLLFLGLCINNGQITITQLKINS